VELKVEGRIPAYAAGTLFRTGPGVREVETKKGKNFRVNHWFDYLSLCHRFQIHEPDGAGKVKVTYNSRSTCDGLIKQIQQTGKWDQISFGAKYDPCTSFFKKASSFFKKSGQDDKPDDRTLAVTMSVNYPALTSTGTKTGEALPAGKPVTLANKSDNDYLQMLDPETLAPTGIAQQKTLHPELTGPASATHAKSDPTTGDVYNYNLDFVTGTGKYRVFVAEAASAKVSILATITAEPAYLHSLFLTENYVVLCIWNSTFAYGGASILWNKNIADAIAPYDARRRPTWHVVDRRPGGRGLVATFTSDNFYAFHSINAYECPSPNNANEVDIIADVTAYPNLDIIKRYYIDNLTSTSESAAKFAKDTSWRPQMRRFRLPNVPVNEAHPANSRPASAVSEFAIPRDLTPEVPTIDPRRATRKHRYVYGVIMMGKSTLWDGLVKYDVETHEADLWMTHGHSVSEPIFVPNPDAPEGEGQEDDGVLLSVVLDGHAAKSYLLVLDAKNMKELGRAHVNGVVGHGFHGSFVGNRILKGAEAGVLQF
jgi:torulene dioxygenase